MDYLKSKNTLARFKFVFEKEKKELSYNETTYIDFNALINQKYYIIIFREIFEKLYKDI